MSAFSHYFERFCYCLSIAAIVLSGSFVLSYSHASSISFPIFPMLLIFLDVHCKADKEEFDCLIWCFDLK